MCVMCQSRTHLTMKSKEKSSDTSVTSTVRSTNLKPQK